MLTGLGTLETENPSQDMFFVGGAAISWKSHKQTCVALLTAESEYIAFSAAAQEAVWLQWLSSDISGESSWEKKILEDDWLISLRFARPKISELMGEPQAYRHKVSLCPRLSWFWQDQTLLSIWRYDCRCVTKGLCIIEKELTALSSGTYLTEIEKECCNSTLSVYLLTLWFIFLCNQYRTF